MQRSHKTVNFQSLDIDLIKLRTQHTARENINYFESLNSTNSYLLEQGQCGDICISEKQTNGRGRRGNQWISPQTGNIFFSQCWCLDEPTKYWSLLGLITGIAIAEALQDIGLKNHGVKWPNDIYWQQRKLGGILLEAPGQSGKVVIGIGLNINVSDINSSKIDQPFVGLNDAIQNEFSRDELIIALINRLHHQLSGFADFDFKHFKKTWKIWDILQGQTVKFEHKGEIIKGKVLDINEDGCLGILTEKGDVSFFSSADIRLHKRGT